MVVGSSDALVGGKVLIKAGDTSSSAASSVGGKTQIISGFSASGSSGSMEIPEISIPISSPQSLSKSSSTSQPVQSSSCKQIPSKT